MKRSLTTRGAVTLVAAAGVTVLLSGVSYAFWSVTGTGTGSAAATTAQPLVVTSKATASGLHPGATGQPASVSISNPNRFDVTVSTLSFGAPTVTSAQGTCTTTGVTFSSSVSSSSVVTVPALQSVDVPYTVAMDGSSDNGCQGATFTTTVTASGTS